MGSEIGNAERNSLLSLGKNVLNWIRKYPMILLLLPLVVAILFCERTGVLYPEEGAKYDSTYVHTFVVCSESKHTAKCERYEAQTYGGKVYLYVRRDEGQRTDSLAASCCLAPKVQLGDTIIAQTRIRRIENIGSFDYRKYLLRQGIIGSAYVSDYRLRPSAVCYPPSLQKRLYGRLAAAGLEGDELATVGALTLGYKEDLDPDLRHRFQASGAAHVLAVSGLHTGIIYALLLGLLTLGGRVKPLYENRWGRLVVGSIIIVAMWGYAWLTGMTPSVVRAVVMVSLFEIGRMLYREGLTLNSIAAAAVLILLVRPLDLWSVSFQLSFAATFAIVIFAGRYEKFLRRKEWKGVWGKIGACVIGTIIISLAAQIGTLPIMIYYFDYISSYFLMANLLVLPLVPVLLPCGLISLALGGSVCGIWFSKITWAIAWLMNHAVGWIESLPGSTIPASANLAMVGIYYGVLVVFCVIIGTKKT